MHDEAAPHYIDMIDQTALGHRFLASESAWPLAWRGRSTLGHSAVQGYLLGAEAGFDAVFFAARRPRGCERTERGQGQ